MGATGKVAATVVGGGYLLLCLCAVVDFHFFFLLAAVTDLLALGATMGWIHLPAVILLVVSVLLFLGWATWSPVRMALGRKVDLEGFERASSLAEVAPAVMDPGYAGLAPIDFKRRWVAILVRRCVVVFPICIPTALFGFMILDIFARVEGAGFLEKWRDMCAVPAYQALLVFMGLRVLLWAAWEHLPGFRRFLVALNHGRRFAHVHLRRDEARSATA